MYEETHIVFNKIKEQSGCNDEQLKLLGVSKNKIDKAIHNCVSKGMQRKQAAKTVFNLWLKADPGQQQAKAKEMTLMGFELKDSQWIHSDYTDIVITLEQQSKFTFKQIEDIVLTKQNDSQPPRGDNKTE